MSKSNKDPAQEAINEARTARNMELERENARLKRQLTQALAAVKPRTASDLADDHVAGANAKRDAAERKALVEQVAHLEKKLRVHEEIRAAAAVAPVLERKGRVLSGDKRQACAVAVASDWHVEERVDPAKVNGLNEYNPEIAKLRAARFFAAISWLVREQQSMFTIKRLVLAILGDIITGYIHEELLESNYMSPTKATVFAWRLLVAGIRALLVDDPELMLHIVCMCGNHGRTTQKLRVATAVDNSFEWLLYSMLAAEFSDEQRVTWQIAEGHHAVTDVFGMRVHTHHGDSIRSQGGIGGITVPLNRAAIQWREKYDASLSIVGHFHQYLPGQKLIVNGSLVGYGAYSDWLPSAAPEPPQQAFFLVDSKRGLCQQTPLWVGE